MNGRSAKAIRKAVQLVVEIERTRTSAKSAEAARYEASLEPHELVQSAYLAVRDRAVRYRHGVWPGARWPSLQQAHRALRRAGLRLRRARGGR